MQWLRFTALALGSARTSFRSYPNQLHRSFPLIDSEESSFEGIYVRLSECLRLADKFSRLLVINKKLLCKLQIRSSDRWNEVLPSKCARHSVIRCGSGATQFKVKIKLDAYCVCSCSGVSLGTEKKSFGCEISQRWPKIVWWIVENCDSDFFSRLQL